MLSCHLRPSTSPHLNIETVSLIIITQYLSLVRALTPVQFLRNEFMRSSTLLPRPFCHRSLHVGADDATKAGHAESQWRCSIWVGTAKR